LELWVKQRLIKYTIRHAEAVRNLRVATIFSYGVNEEESDGILDEENSVSSSNEKKFAVPFTVPIQCHFDGFSPKMPYTV